MLLLLLMLLLMLILMLERILARAPNSPLQMLKKAVCRVFVRETKALLEQM